MSWFSSIVKGVLGEIPGVSLVTSSLELVGTIAETVGGETGKKIKGGLDQVAEGLEDAGAQNMTPEQKQELELATMRHLERMEELDLSDTQGGRRLARSEVLSKDEYVRRTRPHLLRIYGKATIWLAFLEVAASLALVFGKIELSQIQADFLMYVLIAVAGQIAGTFVLMFRLYVSKRTTEKLGQLGIQPTTFLDKVGQLFNSRRQG